MTLFVSTFSLALAACGDPPIENTDPSSSTGDSSTSQETTTTAPPSSTTETTDVPTVGTLTDALTSTTTVDPTTLDTTTTTTDTTDSSSTSTGDDTTGTTSDDTTGTTGDDTTGTTGTTGDGTTGTTGDGTTGTTGDDTNACGMANCDVNAVCIPTDDSFVCVCNEDFTGDGVTCIDVDQCAQNLDVCDVNATCNDLPVDYDCTCNGGYSGNGLVCTKNECGNAIVEGPGEVCDDGNKVAGDGCRADCKGLEVCGDGITDFLTEDCDDGDDSNPNDGCHQCKLPVIVDVAAQKINGVLVCPSGGTANTGRKISSDALGNFHVAMLCGGAVYTASSTNFGVTWAPPVATGIAGGVAEAAIEGGPDGVAYVVGVAPNGVFLARSTTTGATWEAPQNLFPTPAEGEVSIDSLGAHVYVEVRKAAGLTMFRNDESGLAGKWIATDLVQANAFHDVIVDKISATVISASDTPAFHIRTSVDGAVSFGAESAPPGSAYISDWAGSKGRLYVVGSLMTDDIDIIPLAAPATSTSVVGLTASPNSRAIDADPLGNAYVVSAQVNGNIQLDRMVFASGQILPADARILAPTGSSPGVGALPNSKGALVVYTNGNDIFAAVEVY